MVSSRTPGGLFQIAAAHGSPSCPETRDEGELGGVALTRGLITLDNLIDVMYLIHKALKTEAANMERVKKEPEEGGTHQNFKLAFNRWASALVFHAGREEAAGYRLKLRPHRMPLGRLLVGVGDAKQRLFVQRLRHDLEAHRQPAGHAALHRDSWNAGDVGRHC